MNTGVLISDILHMIQNPHLHVGPRHLYTKLLQMIKQVALHILVGYSSS